MMKAIIIARVSTEEQREANNSLPAQIARLERYCHIKDFEAFSRLYHSIVGDTLGEQVLQSLKKKNLDLLMRSGKDFDLLKGVYGDAIANFNAKS